MSAGPRVTRPNARRYVAGRGKYTDDFAFPRLVHVAYVRSPYAHARIVSIDTEAASRMPGVVRVFTGADIANLCTPMTTIANHLPAYKATTQQPLAIERVTWQGEAVAAVVAETRAEAEDAGEAVSVDYEELPTAANTEAAAAPGAVLAHPALGTNLAISAAINTGDGASGMVAAEIVVEESFVFGRHTGVTLEPRTIVADYDPSDDSIVIHQSHQVPFQTQDIVSRHLGIPEHRVRVICPDVGGGFGLKLHSYADELVAAAISKALGRPVKYAADRLEAFVADAHARDHRVKAKIGIARSGDLIAFDVDDLVVFGAHSTYPRLSVGEGMMVLMLAGAPYKKRHFAGKMRGVYQNKTPVGTYRGVGMPIGVTVTELMMERAARAAGADPLEFRRRNFITDDMLPATLPMGIKIEQLTLHQCLDKIAAAMDYKRLRAEQESLRARNVHRGIGLAPFIEYSAVGPWSYGPSGTRLTSQDGATVKLEASGTVRCITSITDQGQGTFTGIAQVVAEVLGVAVESVTVHGGDTASSPHGGGAWASRGLVIGGEAAHRAATELRANVLRIAGSILQADPASLTIAGGEIRDAATGTARLPLAELTRIAYFRQDTLPPGSQPELAVTRAYVPRDIAAMTSNGVQASYLEVDVDTGFVKLLGHWVVEDCGRIVNPLLVDEQIRGGVVQGLGAALFEECRYDEYGQLQNGTLADYLVPMAAEMPDIHVGHVESVARGTALGLAGVGEAGVLGSAAAVLVAVNDALLPLGAKIAQIPLTPDRILAALGKV